MGERRGKKSKNSFFGVKKMQKMKSLLPSLKEKKRYIAFEAITKNKLSDDSLKIIVRKINSFLGVLESAEAGIMPIEFKNNKGIIKVNHKYVDKVKSAFTFINEINNEKIILRSLAVSGMINKARKYVG